MDPEQRAALLAAKLRTLVSETWRRDASGLCPTPFQVGAGLVDPATRTGWCLVPAAERERDPLDDAGVDRAATDTVEDTNLRGWAGGAIVWAHRNAVDELHVLVDHGDGGDARRLALFRPAGPGRAAPRLWKVVGRGLVELAPTPFVAEHPPTDAVERFAPAIREAGADPVIEHGVLRAEHLGLEIGRAVRGEDAALHFEVGVGRHDRLANQMLGQDRDLIAALINAREAVARYRIPGAGPHPANQLVPARWLRALIVADPSLAGLTGPLRPVEGTEPSGLKRPTPAIALGAAMVVGCTVGLDLDAPVFAADARAAYAPDARLVLVIPKRNIVAPLQLLCDCLPDCELRGIETEPGR